MQRRPRLRWQLGERKFLPPRSGSRDHACNLALEWRDSRAGDWLRCRIRWVPEGIAPSAFVPDVGPDGVQASAATFNGERDGQILAALVPDALRVAAANNRMGWGSRQPQALMHASPYAEHRYGLPMSVFGK